MRAVFADTFYFLGAPEQARCRASAGGGRFAQSRTGPTAVELSDKGSKHSLFDTSLKMIGTVK